MHEWQGALGSTLSTLERAYASSPHAYFVVALRETLRARGDGNAEALGEEEWAAATRAPTPEELKELSTPSGRRAAVSALHAASLSLREEAARREADAIDSGEADVTGLPLPRVQREALQVRESLPLLRGAVRLARAMSLLVSALHGEEAMGALERATIRSALEEASTGLDGGQRIKVGGVAAALEASPAAAEREDPLSAPLTPLGAPRGGDRPLL